MIRAASKNHDGVAVVVDPNDYASVLESLQKNELSLESRRRLAAKAYAHTASYDTAITRYLSKSLNDNPLGERILHAGNLVQRMRYGENPHQDAAFTSTSRRQKARSRRLSSCRAKRCRITTLQIVTQRLSASNNLRTRRASS